MFVAPVSLAARPLIRFAVRATGPSFQREPNQRKPAAPVVARKAIAVMLILRGSPHPAGQEPWSRASESKFERVLSMAG